MPLLRDPEAPDMTALRFSTLLTGADGPDTIGTHDLCVQALAPYSAHKRRKTLAQGNRVKKSCGNKACKEIIVPAGDLAPKA